MFDLTGKVALVTGSSQGLGAAIARCLAEAGADVAVNYTSERSLEKAETVAEFIRSKGRRAIVIRADVSREEDVKRMIETVDKSFGRLDILCCNAGINSSFDIYDMTLEEWQRIQDTNITGTFLSCKYALPVMKRNGFGRIIVTSSVVAQQGALFGQVHYAATKGALQSFAKTLARTVVKDGITVNSVAPGSHMTETWHNIVASHPERYEAAVSKIPMGRLGTCEDIGYAVVYLASDEANYVTGACLDVNGGIYMRS